MNVPPVVDASVKPPFAGARHLRAYSAGGALAARAKRSQPPDAALITGAIADFVAGQVASGIVRSIVHAKAEGPGFDPTDLPEALSNDTVASIVAHDPARLAGLASFDTASDRDAPAAAQAAMAAGFIGLTILPGYMPAPTTCDDPRHFPFYETCSALGAPVVILCGGAAGPDLTCSSAFPVDRVAANFPRLKIIAAHGGFPNIQPFLGVVYRRANLWLMPDMYFPGMPGEHDLLAGIASFASERVLFSSAYPMSSPRAQIERIARLPLSPRALERFLGANASDVFGLS